MKLYLGPTIIKSNYTKKINTSLLTNAFAGGIAVELVAAAIALALNDVVATAAMAATVDAGGGPPHAIPVEHGCVADGFVLASQALLGAPKASAHSIFRTWTPAPHDTEHYGGLRINIEWRWWNKRWKSWRSGVDARKPPVKIECGTS